MGRCSLDAVMIYYGALDLGEPQFAGCCSNVPDQRRDECSVIEDLFIFKIQFRGQFRHSVGCVGCPVLFFVTYFVNLHVIPSSHSTEDGETLLQDR